MILCLTPYSHNGNDGDLEKVAVPRCYHPVGFGTIVRREIHAFSDVSKDAIRAAAYLHETNDKGEVSTSLLF